MLSLARMSQIDKYDRGDDVSGMAAEMNRADKRRSIIEAVEKRLDGRRDTALAAKTGDSKESGTSIRIKRRRPGRLQGFFRE
jgi:hypothetical protein